MSKINIYIVSSKKHFNKIKNYLTPLFPKGANFYYGKNKCEVDEGINFLILSACSKEFSPDNLNCFTIKSVNLKELNDQSSNFQSEQLTFTIKNKKGIKTILKTNIAYVEIMRHKLYFFLSNGEIINATGSLKQVERNLDDKRFVRCNYCYLVNLNYVKKIDGYLVDVNGKNLVISQTRRKKFIDAVKKYNPKINKQ